MISISQRGLYTLAIALWLFAGGKVLAIAFVAWRAIDPSWLVYAWMVGAFVFFSLLVFPRAVPPNVAYVQALGGGAKHPLYRCFKPTTWGIMAFMMTLGITLRLSSWVSDEFIAGFYTGLGVSLILAIRFYRRK